MSTLEPALTETRKEANNLWMDYWNHEDFWNKTQIWKINAAIAYLNLRKAVPLKKSDTVLNIGCGPGYFENLLAKHVSRIVACDVSENFLRHAQKICEKQSNVELIELDEDYTNVDAIAGPFNFILCNSVVQYYKDKKETLDLIRSVQKIAAPDAKMLIADLPAQRNVWQTSWDLFYSLLLSIPGQYFLEFSRVLYDFIPRGFIYRMYQRAQETLVFSNADLECLKLDIQNMGLHSSIINHQFSCYANRSSLIIYF